ncbi:MAG TPA: Tm-1-like ATP-binding domain-containing protein, partial [Devosia sp.]|nr:Tm-1-like ATP-binding domain-containing protein [Devosia sp.]
MATVVLVGTLDTKGAEYGFVRERLKAAGLNVTIVDCGILGEPQIKPDIPRADVARAAGTDIAQLVAAGDRGAAVQAMARGAEAILKTLHLVGHLQGVMALGGGGGTSIAARAFQSLPFGLPKLIVTTMASGDTRPYVGESDIILIPSVVDVAGVNRISARVLGNAAAAMAGILAAPPVPAAGTKKLIAASMFGVTTPSVTEGRRLLEAAGYEVLTFHMTGTGGRTLESLVDNGLLAGVDRGGRV